MSALVPVLVLALGLAWQAFSSIDRSRVAEQVTQLTRESTWTLVRSIPIGFRTFHPQGLVKIGDTFYVSSVEVRVRTERRVSDGHDRTAGEGAGHLFKIAANGRLEKALRLGDGTMYHPGGLDFDGRYIWTAVAEYRPNSRSIIYRIDPDTMIATEMFRFDDHIGAVVRDTDDNTLYGISWGSRRFYRWTLNAEGRITNAQARRETISTANRSHFIDYQDCKYAGAHRMLCSGVTELRQTTDAAPFRLGGLDLIALADGEPLHQVPVLLWTRRGLDMTHNPTWFDATPTGLQAYFMPEDDESTIYVYQVRSGVAPIF